MIEEILSQIRDQVWLTSAHLSVKLLKVLSVDQNDVVAVVKRSLDLTTVTKVLPPATVEYPNYVHILKLGTSAKKTLHALIITSPAYSMDIAPFDRAVALIEQEDKGFAA